MVRPLCFLCKDDGSSKCQGILESALGKNDIVQTINMEFHKFLSKINVNGFLYRSKVN